MIGLSTSYYAVKGFSIVDSVSKIAELGFNTVEMGAAHKYENGIWETLKRIKREFPGIVFTVHSLFPPLKQSIWFNPSDGLTDINKEILDNLFEGAVILGSKVISLHPPFLNKITIGKRVAGNFEMPVKGDSLNKEESRAKFIDLMSYADRKAGKLGIKVLIENMDTNFVETFLSSSREFSDVFKKYKNTGFLLDVGHAMLCSNLEDMLKLSENVCQLHIHATGDVDARGRWAHTAVNDKFYYYKIRELLIKPDIPVIFEHGADVPENEIKNEKKILEEFIKESAYLGVN